MKKLLNFFITLALLAVLGWALWRGFTHRQSKEGAEAATGGTAEAEKKDEPEPFVVKLEKGKWKALALEMAEPEKAELKPVRVAHGRVLDPTPIVTLDGELAGATAALAASRAEYERTQSLLKSGEGMSRKIVETAEAQFRADEIKADGLRRKAQIEWGATVSGLDAVKRREFAEQLASGESALVRVELLAGDAVAAMPEAARLVLFGHEDEPMPAATIAPAMDADAKTQAQGFLLRVDKPRFALRPGMAVAAWLALAEQPRQGFAVPRSAILRHDGRTWVFIQAEEERFVRKAVALIAPLEDAKGWFVSGGGAIQADDLLVVTGAQALLSEELKAQGGGEKD